MGRFKFAIEGVFSAEFESDAKNFLTLADEAMHDLVREPRWMISDFAIGDKMVEQIQSQSNIEVLDLDRQDDTVFISLKISGLV